MDREQMKSVQRELRRKTREGKSNYRRRMEEQLQQSSVSGVWRSLNTISGHNNNRTEMDRDQEWVNDLNRFFKRFERPATPPPTQPAQLQLPPTGASAAQTHIPPPLPVGSPLPLSSPTFHSTNLTSSLCCPPATLQLTTYSIPFVSDTVICSKGAPTGDVLAPLLFTMYTSDFTNRTTATYKSSQMTPPSLVFLTTETRGSTQN